MKYNELPHTIIKMASSKKEAIEQMTADYGDAYVYLTPYKYASKGNNFYEFKLRQ